MTSINSGIVPQNGDATEHSWGGLEKLTGKVALPVTTARATRRLSVMPLHSGEIFAGYVIQRLLGTGGMGEVYLAQHPRLPRQDALKILSLASTADGEFRARFIREAELAATLRHPHIVGVLDRGEYDGQLWISMDYVDGTDSGRLIRDRYSGGMPEQDVMEIVTAVADALDFGHDRRLLHRTSSLRTSS